MSKKFKRILSVFLVATLCVTGFVLAPVNASNETNPVVDSKTQEILKAGTVSVRDDVFTTDNPFPRGAQNSNLFRIPGLITLQNGTILASSDARHTGVSDNGGHDVHAAISSDGGKIWYQSIVFQFVDSVQQMDTASTIMDANIVQSKDGTIFCMVNAYTGGTDHAKNTPAPVYVSAFIDVNGVKRIAVTDDFATNSFIEPSTVDESVYPYYVGDFVNGFANIIKRADNSATEYAVDKYFNLYYNLNGKYSIYANGKEDLTQVQVDSDTLVQQNLFYEHSVLHVCSTDYHFMMTSTDNGRSWTVPEIMDDVLFRGAENQIITSPGAGLTTTTGDILFPIYCKTPTSAAGYWHSSILFSSDGGKTWQRTDDVDHSIMSSENQLMELPDGTVRMFFRNKQSVICYVDFKKENGNYVVGKYVATTETVRSDCFISAILTSHKTEDGKPIIIASAPSDPTTRANGKLFAYALETDNSISLIYDFPVNTGWYAYSCLTERPDGKIALIYEHNTAAYTFEIYDIEQLLGTVFVELSIGESYSDVILSDTKRPVTKEPDSSIGTVKNELINVENFLPLHSISSSVSNSLASFDSNYSIDNVIEKAEFTFTGSDTAWQIYNEATGYYLSNQTQASEFFKTDATTMKVVPSDVKDGTFIICRASGKRHIMFGTEKMHFDSSGYDATVDGFNLTLLEKKDTASANDTIPGYKAVTTITSGKKYLIAYQWTDGSYIILYAVNGTSNQTKLVGEPINVTKNVVTFTGVSFGETYTEIGGITYKIICHYDENETVDNMPPRIEGVENGKTYGENKVVTVEDMHLTSVVINGEDKTQLVTVPSTEESVTLTFDKDAYNYTTLATGTGRDTSGVASATSGDTTNARIYVRPEGVDGSGAIKWATSKMTCGIMLGAQNVIGGGYANSFEIEPDAFYKVTFKVNHSVGVGITLNLIGTETYEVVTGYTLASKTLSSVTSGWQEYTLEFKAPDAATLGNNKYLSFIISKPDSLASYTLLLDNLTISETIDSYSYVNPSQKFDIPLESEKEYVITATDKNYNSTTVTFKVAVPESNISGDCFWSLSGTVLSFVGSGSIGSYSDSSPSPWGTEITKVILPVGVTTIGDNAFIGCNNLTEVEYNGYIYNKAEIDFGIGNDALKNAKWNTLLNENNKVIASSIRKESGSGQTYKSAAVRFKARIDENTANAASEIGYIIVPKGYSLDSKYALKGINKGNGENIVYANEVDGYFDYQVMVFGLTREGNSKNLCSLMLDVYFYYVVDGQTYYCGETYSDSYNEIVKRLNGINDDESFTEPKDDWWDLAQ